MSKAILPDLGSLFMVGIPGKGLDPSTINLVEEFHIHNFILFTHNVESKVQLQALCTSLSTLCLDNYLPAPLISIDQEGGSVTRLPPPFSQFADQRKIVKANAPTLALRDYAKTCATELKEVGINMNLAPVLDICPEGKGFFMEQRCLGDDPVLVGQYGSLVINEMQNAGVAACAKHFPGLGKAVPDPHRELPTVTTCRKEMAARDFLPFKAACDADVAAFMTSHTIYQDLDPQNPATLSPFILQNILRKHLGFSGLVITDDLEMGAIEANGSIEEAALTSFLAGADLLLICHDHDKIRRSFRHLSQGVQKGIIDVQTVNISIQRQSKVRRRFCANPQS